MQALRNFRAASGLVSTVPRVSTSLPNSSVAASAVDAAVVADGGISHASLTDVKVVTYNILANKYAIGGNHHYCPPEHLDWTSRGARIRAELCAYGADIVCLQEVETDVFQHELQSLFAQQGLQGIHRARQSGEVAGAPEGVALFVNTNIFDVLQSDSVRFSDHAEDVAASAHTDSDGWRIFNQKEEGVVMAMLLHKPTGQKVLAASTHLFWNPRYPDVKVLQAAVLCIQLAAFARRAGGVSLPSDVPLVLGGDFNSLPCKLKPDIFDKTIPRGPGGLVSGVYRLLQEGILHPSHPDYPFTRQMAREASAGGEGGAVWGATNVDLRKLQPLTAAGLNLRSMYHLAHGREPVLTTKTNMFAGCLDYIWLSADWWSVVETLELPYEDPGSWTDPMSDVDFSPIPDQTFPSDHLAMGCILSMKENV